MAIVKVYAVRNKLHRAVNYAVNEDKTALSNMIEYAANPDKTEERLFETAINCSSVENAYDEMIATKKKYGKEGDVLAYHYIQSFAPNEVTPELAHRIGVEFATECFGDRFEVVVGTHIDRKHIHNHIVVNSVSFADGGKLRSTPDSYYNIIRKTSDRLCAENELSVIEKPQNRGMHYAEWKAMQEGKPTVRGQIRADIDDIISRSKTMIHFYELLRKSGYEIRSGNRKYVSVKPRYAERFIRLKSLGDNYTEERINERIRAARNGIRELPQKFIVRKYKVKGNITKIPRKKLKGFQALYFHYLYLFKKIRRRQAPPKAGRATKVALLAHATGVSAFLRDELIKFERYQRQFHFLCDHNIETAEQLEIFQKDTEKRITELTEKRKPLYKERNNADGQGQEEISQRISKINEELKNYRQALRLCKSISEDTERIAARYAQARDILSQEMRKEEHKHEHKRRSR